ncbi:hypothetical protein A3A21_00750, partial [Candidatus Jorgensenbacteria bacterium RIFCSPLOWO2_01_FULL_45_25b]
MKTNLRLIKDWALDCLFPPVCFSCKTYLNTKKEKNLSVCEICVASIKVHFSLFCSACNSRLPANYQLKNLQTYKSPCHPKELFALAPCGTYENKPVRELIHALKYREIRQAIHPITELLIKPYIQKTFVNSSIRLFETNSPAPWERSDSTGLFADIVLVPLPLAPKKERKRGFNQAELIARALQNELARRSDVPNITASRKSPAQGGKDIRPPYIETNILRRARHTDPQAEQKTKEAREENVKNCFTATSSVLSTFNLQLTTFIIVDDVFTSGATMREAARTLKQAGAKHIIAFVLA